ncbi:MAG: hypothetical protein HND51_15180 [Chloroflexi bacterium]|nr:hypothetical protein [Chloroflexota bacterium]
MAVNNARRLEYHDRFALQQADQAIRKDMVRALVELITNSNDSYHRLEEAGIETDGLIIIEIQRKMKNGILRIRDYAEGMDADTMNQAVGTYGAPTSGFLEGQSVRGLWGRGLKDSFYGLGHGTVTSIKDDLFYQSRLFIEDGAPMYEPPGEAVPVTEKQRKQYQIPEGNGTVMEIILSRPDVPVPRVDTLRFKLQQHFELRTIMENPQRDITLRELKSSVSVKNEFPLGYRAPTGIRIYNEAFYVTGHPALVHLEVYRSDEPLTTVSDVGDFADGGLLVISRRVVMALTLLKYNHNDHASRVYGTITCDYLHDLLQKEETEPILTATRDGLNWDHPFMKELRSEVELRLDPLVQAERRLAQQTATRVVDQKLRKRFNSALKRLNSIASSVLSPARSGKKEKTRPDIPFNGFGFTKEFASVQSGRATTITLRAIASEMVRAGETSVVLSENREVSVLTPTVQMQPRKDFPDIIEAKVQVEGRQVGAESVVTAKANGHSAEALVRVTSRPKEEKSAPTGFITDLEFSPTADPRQRAVYDREAAKIIIATQSPSVAPYLSDGGAGANTPQGQVLLAEMVTDVICREIARVGVQSGKLPAFHEDMEASIQAHVVRLQHEFAHEIHAYFVDSQYRRKTVEEE